MIPLNVIEIFNETFLIVKFTYIFIYKKKRCLKKGKTNFGNRCKFPTIDSLEVIVLTPKKSWGDKIQFNLSKSIGVFNRTF